MRISDWSSDVCSSDLPQRIAADQAYCASCSLSSLLPRLAQPVASSTTATASQQCFRIRIAFLLPGYGVAARVATPRSSVLARDRDVACAAGGRDAAVGQRYRRDHGGRSEEHTSEHQSLMR